MKKVLSLAIPTLLLIAILALTLHVNAANWCAGHCSAWAGAGHYGDWDFGATWATGSATVSSAHFVNADLWAAARVAANPFTHHRKFDVDGPASVIADQVGPYGEFAHASAGARGSYVHNAGQDDEWVESGLWAEDGKDLLPKDN